MEQVKDIAISILSSAVALALISVPVYIMWNWLIPNIFNLPYIDYVEAWGLMAFAVLLNSIFGLTLKSKKDK
jgi:hypothetical protein